MMITIESKLANAGLKAAAALIHNVDNTARAEKLADRLTVQLEALRASWPSEGPRALPEIVALQGVYRQLGASWRNNRPSIERLAVMIAKGRPLPAINPVVDIYNVASLEARMCMGAHDAEKLVMPISLRQTTGIEQFMPLGGEPETVPANEFAYFDDAGRIICRLDAVQADFSKVGPSTRTVVLIVEGTPISNGADVLSATERTAKDIAAATGGAVRKVTLAALALSEAPSGGAETP
jgi:DNA/RNA-binding domain of Phe-tRNA-synthetase-like protein